MYKCAGVFNYQDFPIVYSRVDVNKDVLNKLNGTAFKAWKTEFVRAIMYCHKFIYTRKERIKYTLKQLRKRGCICYIKQYKHQIQKT